MPFFHYDIKDLSIRLGADNSGFELSVPELQIKRGERVALVGASGCGKSTLLDALALVNASIDAQQFDLTIAPADRENIIAATTGSNVQNKLAKLRRHHIGYVLQSGGLIPFLTVKQNIEVTRDLLGMKKDETVGDLAECLGISGHLNKFPGELSVGERQRVAIARAMAHHPKVVIADEPTAALDAMNSDRVMALFVNLVEQKKATLIVASHDVGRIEDFKFRSLKQRFLTVGSGSVTRSEFTN